MSAQVLPSLRSSCEWSRPTEEPFLSHSHPPWTLFHYHCSAAVLGIYFSLLNGKFLEDQDSIFEMALLPVSSGVQGTEETFNKYLQNDERKMEGRIEGKK